MANEKRLIQRSLAQQYFKALAKQYEGSFTGEAFKRAAREIAEMPGVDAVEVVHGRWISHEYDMAYSCSICGYITDWHLSNYCHNCGADMRGDTNG